MTDQASIDYVRAWINVQAIAGYRDLSDVTEELSEVLEGEGIEDEAPYVVELSRAFAAHKKLEATWDDVTVNDKITLAFNDLFNHNIIALENAGYTQTDGWEDLHEAKDSKPDAIGGAFFHGQDIERGVTGAGLHVRFGSFESQDKDGEIARIVVDVLNQHGVPATWDNDPLQTIQISPFEWRRRRSGKSTDAPKPKKSGFFGFLKRR